MNRAQKAFARLDHRRERVEYDPKGKQRNRTLMTIAVLGVWRL